MNKESSPPKKNQETGVGGKLAFIGKVILFFVSFGFIFPTLFSD